MKKIIFMVIIATMTCTNVNAQTVISNNYITVR